MGAMAQVEPLPLPQMQMKDAELPMMMTPIAGVKLNQTPIPTSLFLSIPRLS